MCLKCLSPEQNSSPELNRGGTKDGNEQHEENLSCLLLVIVLLGNK